MQLDTGDQFAVVHATCLAGTVDIHAVKFVSGADGDAKEAADSMATALGISPDDLYVIPAGSLTKPAKRGRASK